MKALSLLAIAGLALLPLSCKREAPSQKTYAQFARIDSEYSTNDVQAAEEALLRYLNTLSADEARRMPGIDYDMARAIAHERLFLIYKYTAQTNKMQTEYERSFDALTKYASRSGLPPPERVTYDRFAEKIEKSESYLDVKWKRLVAPKER